MVLFFLWFGLNGELGIFVFSDQPGNLTVAGLLCSLGRRADFVGLPRVGATVQEFLDHWTVALTGGQVQRLHPPVAGAKSIVD